jgi:deferrochelatase/peroxidase EfeB
MNGRPGSFCNDFKFTLMESLELSDIQGYIIRGYKYMQYSRYALLRVVDPVAAKKFLRDNVGDVTNVTHHAKTNCLNIAFTCSGLGALGLKNSNLAYFTREFREGITSEHRGRLLGDVGSSAPEAWRWGGPDNEQVHLILMVFGKDKQTALSYYARLQQQFAPGLAEVLQLDGQTLPMNKEHFGFRDGISGAVAERDRRMILSMPGNS